MLKVGKHEFIVRSPGTENPAYYCFSNVCDIRAEQIHHFVKTSKHTEHLKIFDKENSVFQPSRCRLLYIHPVRVAINSISINTSPTICFYRSNLIFFG